MWLLTALTQRKGDQASGEDAIILSSQVIDLYRLCHILEGPCNTHFQDLSVFTARPITAK